MSKTAIVCGAGGFIGSHLVKNLKAQRYWVREVDPKAPEFSPTAADEFCILDLRDPEHCRAAVKLTGGQADELHQLAADMGGMGFIHSPGMPDHAQQRADQYNMSDAAARAGVGRYFFSSSACVYRDMVPGEPEMTENEAYPALPNNEYGWEKLLRGTDGDGVQPADI